VTKILQYITHVPHVNISSTYNIQERPLTQKTTTAIGNQSRVSE